MPELGLPALKAKVNTGARTSALHAHDIEVFGPDKAPNVRSDRSGMASRMLLGRQALQDHISITASEERLQPELSYHVYYSAAMRKVAPARSLRIALLSREDNYSTRRLVSVGEARGQRQGQRCSRSARPPVLKGSRTRPARISSARFTI